MPPASKLRAQSWLQSPLRTVAGDLQLAGALTNAVGIDPRAMRVLGSYALVLMTAGRGYFRDGHGTEAAVGPGDAMWVFPEIAHAYGPAAGSEWTQVYCVFAGAQFDLWRRTGLISPDRPVWKLGAADYWQQRLETAVKPEARRGGGQAMRAFGRFLQVVTEMAAAAEEAERLPERDGWFEKSLRLLGHRGAAGWPTPQQVAREVGLSYENFRKRFTQLGGESPGRYQKRRRLEWACASIYQGEHTIKQIADELGFCDVFHFSKAFKQVVGTTPSEYRRRVRGR